MCELLGLRVPSIVELAALSRRGMTAAEPSLLEWSTERGTLPDGSGLPKFITDDWRQPVHTLLGATDGVGWRIVAAPASAAGPSYTVRGVRSAGPRRREPDFAGTAVAAAADADADLTLNRFFGEGGRVLDDEPPADGG